MSQASILTIILNFRTPDMTLRAAETALREMQGLTGEVLIIDNGSQDQSYQLICDGATARGWDQSGRVRVLKSDHNGGFGAGMNIGMAAGLADGSQPDFYYLLNSDAFPDPDAIRLLRDFLLTTPDAGMVGSHVRGEDGDTHATAFRFPSIAGDFEAAARTGVFSRLLKRSIIALELPVPESQVDWTAGASLMLRRQMIDDIGTFDETFFLYFEETDLCRRATQAGWHTHYLPTSKVVHIGSVSTGMKHWGRMPSYWFDSRLHYFTKNHGRAYAAAATLALIGGGLIWRLRRLISNRPQRDPTWFLRDLIAHYFRAAVLPQPRKFPETRLHPPVPEDSK